MSGEGKRSRDLKIHATAPPRLYSSSDHVHLRGAEGSMRRNRIRNLIASQGLPFETLCIESCLTAVVVVTGGLAVGHGIFERDPGGLERLQECRCRVAQYLVGVSAAG